MKNYGYDPHTGEYNEKMLPEPKEDKQKKNIAKDFKAYFKTLDEYADFLKELIKKYDIKPPSKGNLYSLAFNLNNNTNSKQPQLPNLDLEFITVAVNLDYFPTQ